MRSCFFDYEKEYPYKPKCPIKVKNKVIDGNPQYRENSEFLFLIDSGATKTRLGMTLSHQMFSTDLCKPPDYEISERKTKVETGGGFVDRYKYLLAELVFLGTEKEEEIYKLKDVEVYLVPSDSEIETNIIGLNVIRRLKKLEFTKNGFAIHW